jgi:hypothetical protein
VSAEVVPLVDIVARLWHEREPQRKLRDETPTDSAVLSAVC